MIWLASFPRSGNTFFRNILYSVYDIESQVFKPKSKHKANTNAPVVKTHMLPWQLVPANPKIPAIYIVRDGRDSIVSMAYQRTYITEPGTNFTQNLLDIINIQGDHDFGGWSRNVEEWLQRASVVVRFEDLITHPLETMKSISPFLQLPSPKVSELPTFESQRAGQGFYPKQKRHLTKEKLSQLFFRKGKIGGWKDDMSPEIHELFWSLHGATMQKLGYHFSGDIQKKDLNTLLTYKAQRSALFRLKSIKGTFSFYKSRYKK